MSTRTLLRLLILLAVLVALWGAGKLLGGIRFGSLQVGDAVLRKWDVNAVEEFDLVQGDTTVYLARQEGRWVVHSLHDFAADFPTVARALRTVSDLKVGRAVPDGVEYLNDFGLDPASEEQPPIQVIFRRQRGREMARLFIGIPYTPSAQGMWGPMSGGRYVRVDDGPVVLVSQDLDAFSLRPDDWIRKELVSIQASEVAEVVVAPHGEDAYIVQAKEDGRYEATDLAFDEETDQGAAGRLFRALQMFRCTTVADPAVGDSERGFDTASKFRLTTKQGLVYSVRIGAESEAADGRYVRIHVSTDASYPAGVPEDESRLATLQAMLHGWTFVVPGFTVEPMLQSRERVITQVAPPVVEEPVTEDPEVLEPVQEAVEAAPPAGQAETPVELVTEEDAPTAESTPETEEEPTVEAATGAEPEPAPRRRPVSLDLGSPLLPNVPPPPPYGPRRDAP